MKLVLCYSLVLVIIFSQSEEINIGCMLQILWSTFNCCRSLSEQATYFSQDAEGRRRYNKFVLR